MKKTTEEPANIYLFIKNLPNTYYLLLDAVSNANLLMLGSLKQRSKLFEKQDQNTEFWFTKKKIPFWEMLIASRINNYGFKSNEECYIDIANILANRLKKQKIGDNFLLDVFLVQSCEVIIENKLAIANKKDISNYYTVNSLKKDSIYLTCHTYEKLKQIYLSCQDEAKKNYLFQEITEIKSILNDHFIKNDMMSIRILEHGLYTRESMMCKQDSYDLEIILSLIKLYNSYEELNYVRIFTLCAKAYNIINNTKEHEYFIAGIQENMEFILRNMQKVYNAYEDYGKVTYLNRYCNMLITASNENVDTSSHIQPIRVIESIKDSKIVLEYVTYDISIDDIFRVKKKLQNDILNPIQKKAEKGKWHEIKAFVDWGIAGYIKDSNVIKYCANKVELSIARDLFFEAICIGVMNSGKEKNPLCVLIFDQEYLITYILQKHKEYCVDELLLKICISTTRNFGSPIDYKINYEPKKYDYLEHIIPLIEKYSPNILETYFVKPILKCLNYEDSFRAKKIDKIFNLDLAKYFGNNLTRLDDLSGIIKGYLLKKISEVLQDDKETFQSILKYHSFGLKDILNHFGIVEDSNNDNSNINNNLSNLDADD